ncbi:MAG TPA: ABC transporter permease, partial [Anaerolineales bacterium]|nr:ABC transporter permease [Anaerolineales bacterium]
MKRRDLLFSAAGLVLIWQVAAMLIQRPILPAPWEVLVVFVQELGNGLVTHFFYSLWRVTAGMALSVLIAAPVGL